MREPLPSDRSARLDDDTLQQALHGEWDAIRAVPKSDLHAHAMLSAPFVTYCAIAGRQLCTPPSRFVDFAQFDQYVMTELLSQLTSLPARERVLHDSLVQMQSDGVVRTELSFDLMSAVRLKMSWRQIGERFSKIISSHRAGIVVSPELGIDRAITQPGWQTLAEESMDSGFFAGVDVYGSETSPISSEVCTFIAAARKRGLRIKLHAGEQSSAAQLRREFDLVRPDALQHGMSAVQDESLLRDLVAAKTRLNLSICSNYALFYCSSYRDHPVRKLYDAGIKVTLNTDDYAVFGRSVSEEYVRLFSEAAFSAEELEAIRRNGIEG